MYIIEEDLADLSEWLNAEESISLIQSAGEHQWKAFSEFQISQDGRHCLYHSGGDPLPLLGENPNEENETITNPFEGWSEKRSGANPNSPYFGAGHPSIFWLNVRMEGKDSIGMSSFEWIGNHYSVIGKTAPPVTKKWWERLRRWTKKQTIKVPRSGVLDGEKKEIWAFGGALEAFKAGQRREKNP